MRVRAWWLAIPAAALLAGWRAPAAGQGWIDGNGSLVRLRTTVTARVSGRVAHVQVEEWFQNRGGALAEGDYRYPLPGEGAFADLSLWQGDRELKGETMDAERARAIYEEIVRRRRDPALVELIGHGLLRARVFPIAPGETRRLTLRYTQLLPRAGDALVFRYAAARPGPGTGVRPWLPRPRPIPLVPPGGPSSPVTMPERQGPVAQPASSGDAIEFRLLADDSVFGTPFSPTHELRTERRDGQLTVRPAGELRGDLAVFLPLRAAAAAAITVAAHRAGDEDGYVMLTLSPGAAAARPVPRDLTLVLDVSGSMSGDKLDQAKRALSTLLGSLGAADRFRLVAFSSEVHAYRGDWTPASAPELRAARHWVDALQAQGSTDIAGALREAFRAGTPEGRLPMVVFLTDGLPTAGEQDPSRIAEQARRDRGQARVFAFGIGYDVNTQLLDELTVAGRGSTAYVEAGEDLERPLALLASRIREPVLTDLRLETAPVELRDLYPNELPDLFAGDELVLLARYHGTGDGPVVFRGRRGDRTERIVTRVSLAAERAGDDYIPRLWASRRIGVLTRELRLHGRNAEVENEIRELGQRYGILTEFTSYLVQEPGVLANAPAAPPAFANASGSAAVQSAEAARVRREATSLSAMSAADAKLAALAPPPTGGRADARIVAGRAFTLRDGVWRDAARTAGLRVVTVEPYSAAYFDVLRALPELRPWWSTLEQVELAGRRARIAVRAGGVRSLSPEQVRQLVTDFRRS